MSAEQRIFRLRVIESANFCPGLDVVAGLTTERASVGAFPGHLVGEFALVWVPVAAGAASILKVEGQNPVRAAAHSRFVAIGAGYSGVCSHERKARATMLRDGIRGAMPILDAVAAFATVVVRSRGELVVVQILVTVRADRELHLVKRIRARRNVALRTLHSSVLALQRILSRIVFLGGKKRRIPAVDGVAFRTLAFLRAICELALVGTGRVAILAGRKGDLFLEVVFAVASGTS
jgi:hypothetical protein